MEVDLTLACGEYDLTQALIDGSVTPKGVNLTTLTYGSPERHWRMLRHQEFDICEMSLGSYLTSRAKEDEFPFTAIPVFPHRRFRHSYIFKNSDAGVTDPGDFENGNVGVRTWQTTAGIWMRGIAAEHYGLDLESVTWFADDTEDIPFDLPEEIDLRPIPSDTNLEKMLVDGSLDGAMYPELLSSVLDPEYPVERVFGDSQKTEEAYFEETGIFPLMHTVVIKNEVLERNPWVAVSAFKAFEASRNSCLEKLEDPRWTALAWARQHLEHQQSVLGQNPWPFGWTSENRMVLDTLQQYATDQGLIPRPYEPEELFVANTLDEEIRGKEYVSLDE